MYPLALRAAANNNDVASRGSAYNQGLVTELHEELENAVSTNDALCSRNVNAGAKNGHGPIEFYWG